MKSYKFCVDFDKTVVLDDYPNVGPDNRNSVNVLKRLIESGHKIILNTMRSGKELEDAVQWFKERNIGLYGINQDPDQKKWTTSPKVYGHFYIDDRNFMGPLTMINGEYVVDWVKIELALEQKKFI